MATLKPICKTCRCQGLYELLELLTAIEAGAAWPEQLLVGLVHALDKRNGKLDVEGYRPIVLFSIVYRTWSGIRARQLLRWLRDVISEGALGFLPDHEPAEAWLVLQANIEVAVQGSEPLSGFSADLVKAFNTLPRQPLFAAARWLGIPEGVLLPWSNFLSGMQRRFVVQHCVSAPAYSKCGFPEGCPLSTVAMCICDFMFHRYLEVFTPSIRSLSFVDNLLGTVESAYPVAQGLNATRCFCDALGLTLDGAKTYTWSTDSIQRRILRELGLKVTDARRELGGLMSFGPSTRNRALVDRCRALGPVFRRLSRSRAPLHLKLRTLPTKFWSMALHGAAGCLVSEATLQGLRTQTVRALKLQCSGSSPMLRLSLSGVPTADPGFFQLWDCVNTFRRICTKQPGLLDLWQLFASRFQGDLLHGPFSKLLCLLHSIQWRVLFPPFVQDEEGLTHDLLGIPKQVLRVLLMKAWLRLVAYNHKHRKTMYDLDGIDPALVALDWCSLPSLSRTWVSALQSGANMFGDSQSKFDLEKDGLCALCGLPDDAYHRVCVCPRFSAVRAPHSWVVAEWPQLPKALSHHLLPSANPHGPCLRRLLQGLPDYTACFLSAPTVGECQHIFTDGSCSAFGASELSLAAWSVVNSCTGEIIACGPLHGLQQSAPRAELTAVLSAVTWARQHRVQAVIWCDAEHVASSLRKLLEGELLDRAWGNQDLWHVLLSQLGDTEPGMLQVQHTPSHLDVNCCESPFEDWLSCWNQHADTVAGLCNLNRPWQFQQVHAQAVAHFQVTAARIRALRSIYCGIAQITYGVAMRAVPTDAEPPEPCDPAEDLPLGQPRILDITECLPVGWQPLLVQHCTDLPSDFILGVCAFFLKLDGCSECAYSMTFLEFLAMFILDGTTPFPVQCGSTGRWKSRSDQTLPFVKHTVDVQLRLIRRALRPFLRRFELSRLQLWRLNRVSLGVPFPCDGILVGVDTGLLQRGQQLLRDFFSRQAIRTAATLQRPFEALHL